MPKAIAVDPDNFQPFSPIPFHNNPELRYRYAGMNLHNYLDPVTHLNLHDYTYKAFHDSFDHDNLKTYKFNWVSMVPSDDQKILTQKEQKLMQEAIELMFDKWDRNSEEHGFALKRWFSVDKQFDQILKEKFENEIKELREGKREHWKKDHYGRLAYLLLADQFSRNIGRGKAEAFATDSHALALSKEIVADRQMYDSYRNYEKFFILMPLMHSEDPQDGLQCIKEAEMQAEKMKPYAPKNLFYG